MLSAAQVRWDGEAGDGLWSTALNWSTNLVPQSADDVLLDNSFVLGSYTIALNGSAMVHALRITPATANNIILDIPSGNLSLPALSTTGNGYSLWLDNGAILRNQSGLTAGSVLSVTDSMRISNGGNYIHHSRTAHAALVTQLSRSPGTEKGIFTFDVPGGSYTVAITNRVYGTLVLQSAASGGTQAYATSAANPLTISGDLIIEAGTSFNLDNPAATTVKGNLLVSGVFNIASQANNNTVFVRGDVLLDGGQITETSAGLPVLECNGSAAQQLRVGNQINNSVQLRINNPQGVDLMSDCQLPFQLNLVKGIVRNHGFLITLLPGCGVQADSTNANCFIDGALRKEGLANEQHFLFPVGQQTVQRWVELKEATGNFTISFFKQNPNALSAAIDPTLHHISSMEYWSIRADGNSPAASVELSFNDVNSGGVTDLATLRVAQLDAGIWNSRGNTATAGSAGGSGSVVSNQVVFNAAVNCFFTLASSSGFQNPLPIRWISFEAVSGNNRVQLQWRIAHAEDCVSFQPERSVDGRQYSALARIAVDPLSLMYRFTDTVQPGKEYYYRITGVNKSGETYYSNILRVPGMKSDIDKFILYPSPARSAILLEWQSRVGKKLTVLVTDMQGRTASRMEVLNTAGTNQRVVPLAGLPAGIYQLHLVDPSGIRRSKLFVKL
ncbi:MAG: T9SS type A sorting domain-containing protein [Bacteroidota bacterium]|nr:T9SS type A sorting domain-containing protein [Bacteroidota bacterium]